MLRFCLRRGEASRRAGLFHSALYDWRAGCEFMDGNWREGVLTMGSIAVPPLELAVNFTFGAEILSGRP